MFGFREGTLLGVMHRNNAQRVRGILHHHEELLSPLWLRGASMCASAHLPARGCIAYGRCTSANA